MYESSNSKQINQNSSSKSSKQSRSRTFVSWFVIEGGINVVKL